LEFAIALNRIWQRRRWLAVAGVVALVGALSVAFRVSPFPPKLEARSDDRGAASTHLLVDSARSSLPDLAVPVEALAGRAQVYAELLRTETVRRRIGEEAGIPWTSLFVDGSTTDAADGEPQPSAEEREVELQSDEQDARLFFRVDPSRPIIRITTQAPTVGQAVNLAGAAAQSLSLYIDELQRLDGVPEPRRVEITQLGSADGGEANRSAAVMTGILAGIAILGVGCLLILFVPRLTDSVRRARELEGGDRPSPQSRRVPLRERVSAGAQRVSSRVKQLSLERRAPDTEQSGSEAAPKPGARGNGYLPPGAFGAPPVALEKPPAEPSDEKPEPSDEKPEPSDQVQSENHGTVADSSIAEPVAAPDNGNHEAESQEAESQDEGPAGGDRDSHLRKSPKRKPRRKNPRARNARARKPRAKKPSQPKHLPLEPSKLVQEEPEPSDANQPEPAGAVHDGDTSDR
jgi:hypothetical protein